MSQYKLPQRLRTEHDKPRRTFAVHLSPELPNLEIDAADWGRWSCSNHSLVDAAGRCRSERLYA